jgi:hypothetical protein
VGQPFSHIDKVQEKADWLEDFVNREGLQRWLCACYDAKALVFDHPFAIKYELRTNIFNASLKRELRSKEKIAAKSTRLFYPAHIASIALSKMLFMRFSHQMHTASAIPEFPSRVGFSQEHGGFNRLSLWHNRRSHTGDDDCNKFDTTQQAELIGGTYNSIASCFLEEWRGFVLEFCYYELYATVVTPDGEAYAKGSMNPSGSGMTTDISVLNRMTIELYMVLRFITEYNIGLQPWLVTWAWIDERFTFSHVGDDTLFSFDEDSTHRLYADTFSHENRRRWASELNISLKAGSLNTGYTAKNEFCGKIPHYHTNGFAVPLPTRGLKILAHLLYAKPKTLADCIQSAAKELAYDDDKWDKLVRLCAAMRRPLPMRSKMQGLWLM